MEGYKAGADDYVVKPFDLEELRAKIEVFLKLKRAEEIVELKGDLLSLFSHETRTPLNGIIGMTQLLAMNDTLSKDVKETLQVILDSGNYLMEFYSKTALLCQLKGVVSINRKPSSLKQNISQSWQSNQRRTEEKKLILDLKNVDIELNVDWTLFQKVIGYLLDNAIKYSPEGGVVSIQAYEENDHIVIEISNQGELIPEDRLTMIFDEFAIRDIYHHKRGQGLSLAIARHIMEKHGGNITAQNAKELGATFTLQLPANFM